VSTLIIPQAEYNFLVELAPLPSPSDIASTFNTLLIPIMTLFSNTLSSLISVIKRSIHRYTFLALGTYDSLSALSFRWDELVIRRSEAGVAARRDNNELKEGMHALRAVCLRSFPEFLADIKVGGSAKGGEGTGVVDFAKLVRYGFSIFAF
jgi:exocyst complex component 7